MTAVRQRERLQRLALAAETAIGNRDAAVVESRAAGMTALEIATALGVTPSRVYQILRRANGSTGKSTEQGARS